MKRRILLVTALTGVLALGVVLYLYSAGSLPAPREVVAWWRGLGAAGYALYAILTIVGIVCFVPVVWFAAGAGFLFGPWAGMAVAWPAGLTGALTAFALGRTLLARAAGSALARSPRLAAVDEAIGEGGVRLMVLLRLSVPHNLLNYALSATRVSLRVYATGTAIVTLPFITVFAHGGALARDLDEVRRVGERMGPWSTVLLAVGAVAAVIAVVWIARAARRALARRMAAAGASATAPPSTP